MLQRILVWDIPTRVFHWALALSFSGAYLTAETERYRDLHLALGYIMLGLIIFRLIWGFVGTRYARFSSFTFRPTEAIQYLKSLIQRNPIHYLGHNPLGAIAIFLLLSLGIITTVCGILLYQEVGGEAFEEIHEGVANMMLGIVFIHIAGVLVSSLLHRENLVRAMFTGYKSGLPSQKIPRTFAWLGAIMIVILGGFLIIYQPSGSGNLIERGVQSNHDDD